MSEIPFVNELGDELERAITADPTAGRQWSLRGAWRAGVTAVLMGASALVVVGVVVVGLTLGHASPRKSPAGSPGHGLVAPQKRRATKQLGSPAINLPPGVVTVARLRFPDEQPFILTLQRIRFQGQQYVCLAVTQTLRATSGPAGSGSQTSTQQCEGPLPLPNRPLVAVMGDPTACKPHPAQLIWGLALKDLTVSLRTAGREQLAARRAVPAALRARGTLFYVWAHAAPDSLVARDQSGTIVETDAVNSSHTPVFASECKLHSPTIRPGSFPLQPPTSASQPRR